jgi:hypothetical protein
MLEGAEGKDKARWKDIIETRFKTDKGREIAKDKLKV